MLSDGAISESPIAFSDFDLTGNANIAVAADGSLSTAILLTSNANIALTASGALTYSMPIGGAALVSFSLTGDPVMYRPLAGAAAMSLNASGTLKYAALLGGNASIALSASGALTYLTPLAGSAAVIVSATANLATQILLASYPRIEANASLFSGFVESTGIELDPIPRAGSDFPDLWRREPMQYIGVLDLNDQLIEAELTGRTFYLGISWNEEGQLWTLSVRNLDRQVLVSGIAIRALYPLLRQVRRENFPPGEIIVAISGAQRQHLHRDSFKNGEAVMFYVEPEDLADGAL